MSQSSARRAYQYGSQSSGSAINQKAALASAYQELGKELASSKLKMVGNYTLQRPIGEGTFGKVRLGLHRLTNTRVAIKQIPKAHSASLTREIHHHRRLHHPNVMQLYEVIATEQYIWMVSELCAGGELYDYLVENQVLAEPEARRIFGQLCLAVAYVHSKGIVHRDLKLENILLDERCNVKLGDFGFTREFEAKRLMDTFCGTTGYAAPEMLSGKKYTGPEVDVWSLGVILYALLCGALPFDDDDESVMKDKILRGDFEIPDCLSEEAQSLVASILQQDPTKRPSIQSILAHPWFTKIMVHTPMSTVEEDEIATDYFDSKPLAQPSQADQIDLVTPSLAATPDNLYAAQPNEQSSAPATSTLHQHHATASAISERSYQSARSDSESSDRRSSNTDLTDPTTADSLSRTDDEAQAVEQPNDSAIALSTANADAAPQAGKHAMGLHRNESQTTIRRFGSNGSDASSLGGVLRPSTKSTSTALPTHHELPASSDGKADDVQAPLYQSVPLAKRGSQSSSRGHHRTPSRTKRRSLSSSGLSDHHPPLLGRKPVDYISQLTDLQPATFSSVVEQTLLHQLGTLGMDVGQMVHSVVTDACDASGATWWMLLRKAKDRQREQPAVTSPVAEAAVTNVDTISPVATVLPSDANLGAAPVIVGVQQPPIPAKDPARLSEDKSRPRAYSRSSMTPSRSDTSALAEGTNRRLHTVVSHEELDVASLPSIHASASESVLGTTSATTRDPPLPPSTSMPIETTHASTPSLVQDRSMSSTPDSAGYRPKSQHRHTTAATASPSKLHQMATSLVGGSPTSEAAKARRSSHADRPRSNSLSMKQFAQSVLGAKDKGRVSPPPVPLPDQVIIAGEALPLERAKSPTIFGRRNTVANVKDSMVGRLSNPSTPKKSPAEILDKPRKSFGKQGAEPDLERIKAAELGAEAATTSPPRFDPVKQPASGSSMTSAAAREKSEGAVPSASQDSFSTMSGTPQGSEKQASRGKAGSSFIATVRTWLGGNEKPARKAKAGKKGSAAHRGLGIEGGANAAKSPTGTLGTSGSVSTFASATPSKSPSVRRRSNHYQQTSVTRRGGPRSPNLGTISRRSSNGSFYQGQFDHPPSSFQQSMNRPSNIRRLSAGSITPTGTLYGDYHNEMGAAVGLSRPSRPSSSHSLAHSNAAPRSGLHGKAGSTGSTSSAYRPGQAGSVYSTGSGRRHPRPSHDGSAMVRRHRTYASSTGSPSRHNSYRHDSRPSSIKSRASSPGRGGVNGMSEVGADAEHDGARRSHRSTPRHSLEIRSDMRNDEAGHPRVVAQSIFVAHKSRSPYGPPSANPHLHGSSHIRGSPQVSSSRGGTFEAASAVVPGSLSGLPATGNGTWRHSWGRPPPCWAGPVDPPPSNHPNSTAADAKDGKPKLRDVFANRDDDDWTDDEEESYSGGLGQLGSSSVRSGTVGSSPYATRTDSFRAAAPFSSRYAGVRGIFQPPASVSLRLGNEFTPKLLSTTLHESKDAKSDAATPPAIGVAMETVPPSATGQQQGGSRLATFTNKPVQIIEEEEEE